MVAGRQWHARCDRAVRGGVGPGGRPRQPRRLATARAADDDDGRGHERAEIDEVSGAVTVWQARSTSSSARKLLRDDIEIKNAGWRRGTNGVRQKSQLEALRSESFTTPSTELWPCRKHA